MKKPRKEQTRKLLLSIALIVLLTFAAGTSYAKYASEETLDSFSLSVYAKDEVAPELTVTDPLGESEETATLTDKTQYTVTGTVLDVLSQIESVVVNDAYATLKEDGTWTAAIPLSADQVNTITVTAKDTVGNTSTITRYIRHDSAEPTLTVSAPAGLIVSEPTYIDGTTCTVCGTVSDASGIQSVTVNGEPVTIDSDGAFSTTVELSADVVTQITVQATGNTGKVTTITRYACRELKIVTQPTNVTAAEGEIASTVVTAAGTGLTYQWYYKSASDTNFSAISQTSSDCSLEMNSTHAGCQIYCVITDFVGNEVTTNTVTLTNGSLVSLVTASDYSGIYDGADHGISVTCDGATITYATTSDGPYSATNPTYTEVGTYTTYYKVEKAGYATVTGSANISIGAATTE